MGRPHGEWALQSAISRWLAFDRTATPTGPATAWLRRLRTAAYPVDWDDIDVTIDLYHHGVWHLRAHPPERRWTRLAEMLRIQLGLYLERDGEWQAQLGRQREAERARQAEAELDRELALAQAQPVPAAPGWPSGGFVAADLPLVLKMDDLIAAGEAKSVSAAARLVAPHAQRMGNETSVVDRLRGRYRTWVRGGKRIPTGFQ
jgi:hypothetical protein